MSNVTLPLLFARTSQSTLAFSGVVTNQSLWLPGPGGQGSIGFPMPGRGYVTRLQVWDGTTLRSCQDEIPFASGDRLAIYCQSTGSDFTVKLRLNGNSTAAQVTGAPYNSTFSVVLQLLILRD